MADMPSRRAMLGATGATVASAISGCLFDNPDVEGGHLFVENLRSEEFVIELIVTSGTDREGDQVVSGWYGVPGSTALQFEEVMEAGTAYTITVRGRTDRPEDRVTVTIPTCEDDDDGTRDVSVRTRQGGMGVIPWGCDEDYTQQEEIEYVDASEYQLDEGEVTTTGS